MSTTIHADSDLTYWSRDYWLGHCEGFRVVGPAGRVGLVEAVVGEEDDPEALVVRTGLFGTGVAVVPVGAVELVEPRAERVVLRAAPEQVWR
jgi:hypothetical protein